MVVAATIAIASAASIRIPRQSTITNSHLANFRTWGSPGCSADNQGEYNFEMFDLNICFQIPLTITAESIMVENIATGDDIVCNGEAPTPPPPSARKQLTLTARSLLLTHINEQCTPLLMRHVRPARLCCPLLILVTTTMQQAEQTLGWARTKQSAPRCDELSISHLTKYLQFSRRRNVGGQQDMVTHCRHDSITAGGPFRRRWPWTELSISSRGKVKKDETY